jgi:hypothetical protein
MRGVVRVGCGCQIWAGMSARGVGAAGGCTRFDAVYEKEMVQPLDSERVELCDDA